MSDIQNVEQALNTLQAAKNKIEEGRRTIQQVEDWLEEEINSLAGRVATGRHEVAKEHALEIMQEIAADNERVSELATEIRGLTAAL